MKKMLTALVVSSCLVGVVRAHAQTYQVVPSCGQASPSAGSTTGYMDAQGNICMSGSGSAPSRVTIVGPDGPEGGVSVSINPFRKDPTNDSSALTIGGSWQLVIAGNPLRQRLFLQNPCAANTQGIATTESMFMASRPVAPTASPLDAPGSIELVTCGSYDTSQAVVGISPVYVWAATTGHRFLALEW